jgi:translation initiation factor 5B
LEQSLIKSSNTAAKSKKDKKQKAKDLDEADDHSNSVDIAFKAPVEGTADDMVEEEWGPVKEKKKKGKAKKDKTDVDENERKGLHLFEFILLFSVDAQTSRGSHSCLTTGCIRKRKRKS